MDNTSWFCKMEGIVNLIFSIILLKKYGICGVIAGTIIGDLSIAVWIEAKVFFKERFNKGMKDYFICQLKYLGINISLLFVCMMICNLAISHAQFETIHAYKDGNGRLGRALIPLQCAKLDETEPILFLSEIFELYRPSYQRFLMAYRFGSVSTYLSFFMQCIIEQCNSYIFKLRRIEQIYKEDMEKISSFRGETIYKIMPAIMKMVVFTKKEVQNETGVSVNVVSSNINRLVDMGIIQPDSSVLKKGYRYSRIYDVFIN